MEIFGDLENLLSPEAIANFKKTASEYFKLTPIPFWKDIQKIEFSTSKKSGFQADGDKISVFVNFLHITDVYGRASGIMLETLLDHMTEAVGDYVYTRLGELDKATINIFADSEVVESAVGYAFWFNRHFGGLIFTFQ